MQCLLMPCLALPFTLDRVVAFLIVFLVNDRIVANWIDMYFLYLPLGDTKAAYTHVHVVPLLEDPPDCDHNLTAILQSELVLLKFVLLFVLLKLFIHCSL